MDTGKFSTYVSVLCFDDDSDSDWVAQSDGTQPEEDIHFFTVNESSVQSQGCERHRDEGLQTDGYRDSSIISRDGTIDVEGSAHLTSTKHSAFWKVSERRITQRKNRSTDVFDSSHKGKWVTEKLVVGSGAVECGTSRKSAALEVEEASESSRGETWTCAGRNETKKSAR